MHPACQLLHHAAPCRASPSASTWRPTAGILFALPVLLFQLWRFVTPGLKANEKRYALPFAGATAVLFALGAFVAYLTFPHALRFLINVSGLGRAARSSRPTPTSS